MLRVHSCVAAGQLGCRTCLSPTPEFPHALFHPCSYQCFIFVMRNETVFIIFSEFIKDFVFGQFALLLCKWFALCGLHLRVQGSFKRAHFIMLVLLWIFLFRITFTSLATSEVWLSCVYFILCYASTYVLFWILWFIVLVCYPIQSAVCAVVRDLCEVGLS
jgi:hypothetical protein